jgi:catechol 2,3-dioxygenase
METFTTNPATRIGHVHLRVSDLERAVSFYRDALGFSIFADGRQADVPAVFLAAGDYHHHIGLNTFQSANGTPAPAGHTGLHHAAIVYPNRHALIHTVNHFMAARSVCTCVTLMAMVWSCITTPREA